MTDASSNDSGDNYIHDDDEDAGTTNGYEVYNPPADRFLTAQMWWIASELVRRHPHLRISGVEVDDGARLLIVHDEQNAMSIQWDLVGGCKFLVNGVVNKISWIEMMAALNPHDIVRRIEVATGLGIPKTPPVTTKRALTYRLIASALATATNDRQGWYAVPAPMLHDEDPAEPGCDYFRGFPSTVEARSRYVAMTLEEFDAGDRSVYFFQPFWALLRDLDPVAIFDAAGVIHTVRGSTELMPVYERTHRTLSIATVQVLGAYLP
ncbi:hypothetical protein RCH16_002051 [Cryobacterium sp. MP_M5]|uniref:TY-Chap2 family putative peptide chaperone n=1 Tax=unclassified Cryobacterium TaxID=2649013 RepID=UPI0018CAFD02|nr:MULTISPECIES: hypothetical protein [unclassified Cryobacterium]MBG6058950.1 hypothetical protein [Cryobacterium sp. MP_M3]MEC5177041.1 hypothetical protein [Cryobacterium sp. MP_M5]